RHGFPLKIHNLVVRRSVQRAPAFLGFSIDGFIVRDSVFPAAEQNPNPFEGPTFSFLLPTIELSKESAKQSFRTIGITTIHKTTIAGPVKGVQQVYKSVQLRGTAQHVLFLAQKTAGV